MPPGVRYPPSHGSLGAGATGAGPNPSHPLFSSHVSTTSMNPRRTGIVLALFAFGLLPVLARAGANDVPAFARELPRIATDEPILRFNGKDLSGFYTYLRDHKYEDPNHVFTVKDGMIRITGEEFGALTTGGNFGNYHLIAEWKWGEKTWAPRLERSRDSGILLHCVGP